QVAPPSLEAWRAAIRATCPRRVISTGHRGAGTHPARVASKASGRVPRRRPLLALTIEDLLGRLDRLAMDEIRRRRRPERRLPRAGQDVIEGARELGEAPALVAPQGAVGAEREVGGDADGPLQVRGELAARVDLVLDGALGERHVGELLVAIERDRFVGRG